MPELAQQFRAEQLQLRAGTLRDLLTVWPILQWGDLAGSFPAWLLAAAPIVTRDRARSVDLATQYLAAAFDAAKVIGVPQIVTPPALSAEKLATSMRVTTVVALKSSAAAGKPAAQAMQDAFVQSSGAATRLALDGGRSTVTESLRADPHAVGWQRVAGPRACTFCQALVARGAVYKEDTADFESHDHCGCSAEAVYSPTPVTNRAEFEGFWRGVSDRAKARRAAAPGVTDAELAQAGAKANAQASQLFSDLQRTVNRGR